MEIFTTEQEIPFAGHPVIGTAHYVRAAPLHLTWLVPPSLSTKVHILFLPPSTLLSYSLAIVEECRPRDEICGNAMPKLTRVPLIHTSSSSDPI